MPSLRVRSTWLVVSGVTVLCALLGWATDAWYGRLLYERERSSVTVQAESAARTLEQEIARRIALLAGLRAFAASYEGDRARLDAELPVFGTGLITGLRGVRALQLVHDGRIARTWPLVSNERAVGLNLYEHPDPVVGRDVRRAMTSRRLTITGPVTLVQGGSGLLVRQATHAGGNAYPDLVSIILDVHAILADAGIAADTTADRFRAPFALRDANRTLVAGSPSSLTAPVTVAVRLGDGEWTLDRAPVNGWGSYARGERRLLRVSALLISLLLVGVASMLAGRQARLSLAVLERTRALQAANHELAREVEERRAAVRTLDERAEELRLALTAGHMGIWAWDVEDARIRWDDGVAALFGVDPAGSPLTVEAYLALLAPDDRARLRERVNASLECGDTFQIEHRILRPDGSECSLYATAELQRDAATGRRRLLGVIMDVTTRSRLEEQLRQAQKMEAVGTLAGGVAHDFNNLLTAILGFARLADDALLDATHTDASTAGLHATVRDDLSELIRAGDRAALLTAQLLAFSRRQVVQMLPVDVNAVVAELDRMLSRLLDERITLQTRADTAGSVVRADPGQLSQVVLNLVVNARDALPAGGAIVVATRRHDIGPTDALVASGLTVGPWIELSVSDNGTGMSADVRARVFEPFFTTKPTGQGTGLGLSTVYGIVEAAGGRIFVDSEVGLGTTVRVFWPALPFVESVPTTAPDERALSRGGERVLVVEDEAGVRRLVREILERRGYEVETAEQGREALAILKADAQADAQADATGAVQADAERARRIALVLSDVVMPEMGGLELAAIMREEFPHVPVLLMSGYPAADARGSAPDLPILSKPFAPNELLLQVRTLIDDAPARLSVAG